jgi:hypothetical protein
MLYSFVCDVVLVCLEFVNPSIDLIFDIMGRMDDPIIGDICIYLWSQWIKEIFDRSEE